MNSDDLNNTNMIDTTCSFADDHAADTAAIPAYAGVVTIVKNKLVLINNLNIIGGGTSTGVTLDTNAIRKTMQDDTVKLCNGLLAFAGATNNNTIAAAANYTFDKLKKLPKEDVDDVCEGIQQLANTNALAIKPFGILPADIADTLTAITLYRAAIQDPRQKIIEQKNANAQIHPIIRDIIDNYFVMQLDKMTNTLKGTNDVYVNGYYDARQKLDIGHGTTRIKGTVTVKDSNPLVPIYNAQLKIQSDTDTYIIKSDIDGNILNKVKPAVYIGQADATDFDSLLIPAFEVKLGKTVTLDIQLTHI